MNLNSLFHNEVRLRVLDSAGRCRREQMVKNTLTHAAADVMINALLRTGPSVITHLYARFGDNGANPGNLNPAGDDLLNTVRGDFVASSDGIRGGLWVPTLTSPSQTSTDSDVYQGNLATFFFRVPYNIPANQVSPTGNFLPGTSYIYAVGLAVAVSSGDRTQDLIISTLTYDTPFPVPPGGQLAWDYPFKIEVNALIS